MSWRLNAACRSADLSIFYPEPISRPGRQSTNMRGVNWRAAASVCASCPVSTQCLEEALMEEHGMNERERFGYRGGMSPSGRVAAARRAGLRWGPGARVMKQLIDLGEHVWRAQPLHALDKMLNPHRSSHGNQSLRRALSVLRSGRDDIREQVLTGGMPLGRAAALVRQASDDEAARKSAIL